MISHRGYKASVREMLSKCDTEEVSEGLHLFFADKPTLVSSVPDAVLA